MAELALDGRAGASTEHKAQWTLEHHVEFQKRQGIWAEFVKNMAKPNAAPAAAAPPLTGVPAEKARLAIVASKDASAALWEGPYYQAGSRPQSNLKQAMMLVGTSPSIGRDLLDEDLDDAPLVRPFAQPPSVTRAARVNTVG